MLKLSSEHYGPLRDELGAERCCSLHASHVATTGLGEIWIDRWPAPRAVAAFTGGNLGLSGDPSVLSPGELGAVVRETLPEWERVFIDPGERFAETLCKDVPDLMLWPRILYAHRSKGASAPAPPGAAIRGLTADDAAALGGLDPSIAWISDTHDGPESLGASGRAVGAFVDDRLVSVAAVFYVGVSYEELGVVTEPDYRARGLSAACARVLIDEIRARGRTPCWSTTPDNLASQRVAEKLGFVREGDQRQFMAGEPVEGALPLE